jgi:hypothetical protein
MTIVIAAATLNDMARRRRRLAPGPRMRLRFAPLRDGETAAYCGAFVVGTVKRRGARYVAADRHGAPIGLFATHRAAWAAIARAGGGLGSAAR